MPELGLVIHADLPQNKQALLHRSGRTGRAGRKGLSVMIVPAQHRGAAERLLASAKINAVWSAAPSADAIRARDEENLMREIIAMAEAPAEDDLAAARVLLAERSAEELAAVLVRVRREVLPAPEVLLDPGAFKKETTLKKKKNFSPGKKTFAAKRPWSDGSKKPGAKARPKDKRR
jgi:ATP-dependent RNA helicase DeaD